MARSAWTGRQTLGWRLLRTGAMEYRTEHDMPGEVGAGREGPFAVTEELLYQSASFPFVEDMRSEGTVLADRSMGCCDEADKILTAIATAEATVQSG